MFARSWKRVSNWLHSSKGERVLVAVGIAIGYALLAFVGGVAAILWRIV